MSFKELDKPNVIDSFILLLCLNSTLGNKSSKSFSYFLYKGVLNLLPCQHLLTLSALCSTYIINVVYLVYLFAVNAEASEAVGMIQAGIERSVDDYRGFWDEIGELFGDSFSEDDITFLAEEGGYDAIRHFRAQLEAAGTPSEGLHLLAVNAQAYK